jgi:hypothetical protein
MRAFIFLIVLVIGAASIPATTFAQTYIDPLGFAGKSLDPTLGARLESTTRANQNLQNRLIRDALARRNRAIQNQGLETQLEIEREKTRQLELQLRLRRQ